MDYTLLQRKVTEFIILNCYKKFTVSPTNDGNLFFFFLSDVCVVSLKQSCLKNRKAIVTITQGRRSTAIPLRQPCGRKCSQSCTYKNVGIQQLKAAQTQMHVVVASTNACGGGYVNVV